MSDERAGTAPAISDENVTSATRSRGRKKVVAVGLAVVVLGAGAKFLLLTPTSGAGACPTPTTTTTTAATTAIPPGPPASAPAECAPELGPVLKLDPVMINLADGRYLQLGLALQLTAGTDLKVMTDDSGGGARALDAAVALFGAKTYLELVTPAARDQAKHALAQTVVAAYDGTVAEIYFTSFVMQ